MQETVTGGLQKQFLLSFAQGGAEFVNCFLFVLWPRVPCSTMVSIEFAVIHGFGYSWLAVGTYP